MHIGFGKGDVENAFGNFDLGECRHSSTGWETCCWRDEGGLPAHAWTPKSRRARTLSAGCIQWIHLFIRCLRPVRPGHLDDFGL